MAQRAEKPLPRMHGRRQHTPLGARLRTYFARHAQSFMGGLGRMFKQPLSSAMTIAVIGIALALPAGLHVLVLNGRALSGNWESAVDLSVYLKVEIPLAKAQALADEIRRREDVEEVEVIPADAALAEFKQQSGFGSALDALEENPLPSALIVRPAAGHDGAEAIEGLAAALSELDEIDLVQLDTQWIKRFHAILDAIRRGVALAAAILAAGVMIIVGNTIRLDIQNRREEIEVTKLIGGSDGFIRRPFLYSGFWYGLAGGIFAVLLVHLALLVMADPIQRIAGLYGSQFRLVSPPLGALAGLVGGGAALGWLGSWIAASRHMRRIEPR